MRSYKAERSFLKAHPTKDRRQATRSQAGQDPHHQGIGRSVGQNPILNCPVLLVAGVFQSMLSWNLRERFGCT
jgi:hypothetical protein